MKKKFNLGAMLKESVRRFIVSLKRSPQNIPMFMLLLTFLYFSLNLTSMSNTTAKIQGPGMGLCQFCIMLFSLLSFVCMLNAFPKRKKPVLPMVILLFVMFGIIIFADIHYSGAIMAAVNRAENPIKIDANTMYIKTAYDMLQSFVILIGTTAGLVLTLPIYSKWIRKIKTSVEIEDNGDMGQIEISE